MERTIKLKISGMHCSSCAMNIDGELEDLGVKDVKTSYAKSETSVVFDEDKLSLEKITEAIQKLGYQTEIIGS